MLFYMGYTLVGYLKLLAYATLLFFKRPAYVHKSEFIVLTPIQSVSLFRFTFYIFEIYQNLLK
jgi:hypothetical protein